MSITMKAHVSFPMTIVVHSEALEFVAAARAAVKALSPEYREEKFKKADKEERFKLELFLSDKTDEQVIESIYRTALRAFIRNDLKKELSNSESTARIGDTIVTFEQKAVAGE